MREVQQLILSPRVEQSSVVRTPSTGDFGQTKDLNEEERFLSPNSAQGNGADVARIEDDNAFTDNRPVTEVGIRGFNSDHLIFDPLGKLPSSEAKKSNRIVQEKNTSGATPSKKEWEDGFGETRDGMQPELEPEGSISLLQS
ncbi:hypothetical protein SUGI_0043880 [Cryptomeria japonica]|nr:hypothetical protein SUGI_0043880 [Cryptomeria japonica]